MIKNIVFDMGQVMICWRPEMLIAHLNLSEPEKQQIFREVFRSVEWVRLDRGTVTEEEAAEAMCRRLPENLHAAARTLVMDWWKRPLVGMPGMEELVRELKEKGYGLYLLSNASIRLREYFPRIPGADAFDGFLVSAEHKLLKPQHEIYEKLFHTFGLDPRECFFVDDAVVNIEGALECGMEGFVFRENCPELRRELQRRGIL